MYLCRKKMKRIIFILFSVLILASCGKDEPWSPEDDAKDFLEKNPYGVEFENCTEGDLYIKCEKLSSSIIIVKSEAVSGAFHTSEPGVTIKYSGDGTRWTEKTRYIELEKDKITHVTLTYP